MKGIFVAVGQDGLRMSSDDGTTWKNAQTGKEGETYRAVVFGNGKFVAVGNYGGDNIVASTGDGAAWETGKKEARYSKFIRGLGYDSGAKQFIGIGGDPGSVGNSKPFIVTSSDGKTWGDYLDVPGKTILRRLAFGNGLIVGVGDRGRRASSRDGGNTWQDAPDTKPIDTLADVTFGGGKFVGVGLHGLRMASADGLTWSTPQRGEEGEHLNSIIWSGTQFVAVGFGATYFSGDGAVWKRVPNQNAPLIAVYGDNTYVGTQWKGRILTSKDAITWIETHKSPQHVESLCFGG